MIITLAEYEATQVKEEEQDKDLCFMEGIEKVVKKPNEGELLVLRRTLSGLNGNQDEKRENIFHSRCTAKGRVCLLIIDSKSCTNMSSSSMVEKLNLQAMILAHTYNIQWLN